MTKTRLLVLALFLMAAATVGPMLRLGAVDESLFPTPVAGALMFGTDAGRVYVGSAAGTWEGIQGSSLTEYGFDFGPFLLCAQGWVGSTTLINQGFLVDTLSIVNGSANAVTLANNYLRQDSGMLRSPRVRYVAGTTTANQYTSLRNTAEALTTGGAAGVGGFVSWFRWGYETDNGTMQRFAGIRGSTSAGAVTCATTPQSHINSIYMGCEFGDTNFKMCSNSRTGNATCVDMGANFSCTAAPAWFDVVFIVQPNPNTGSSYWVKNIETGATFEGDFDVTDFPLGDAGLAFEVSVCNGVDAGPIVVDLGSSCVVIR